jgi:hypothetical protein
VIHTAGLLRIARITCENWAVTPPPAEPVSSPITPGNPASSGVSLTVSAMATAAAAQITEGAQNSQRQCSGGM